MANNVSIGRSQGSAPGIGVRVAILALGLAGMGISGYLTYIHYRWVEPVCLPGFDCGSVLFSPYATFWGVPISLLGLVIYSFLTAGGVLLFYRPGQISSLSALGVYTLALSGTLYSLFLTYRELFRMYAVCMWCLSSALVITCLLVLSIINLPAFGWRIMAVPHLIFMKLSRRYSGNRSEL